MSRLAAPAAVVTGIVLILVVNLMLLGAAGWSHRGKPLSELVLTERELRLPIHRQEPNAGIVLSVQLATRAPELLQRAAWIRRTELPEMDHTWFDRPKLRDLGFSVDFDPDAPDAARHYNNAQFRRAYIVLEYDGDTWSRWLASREDQVEELRRQVETGRADTSELADAEAQLAFDSVARSRLVPVDVGPNASELQERYSDPRRFAVLPALVQPMLYDPEEGPPVLLGRVADLLVSRLHVPRKDRGPLDPFVPTEQRDARRTREREQAREGWPRPTPPRYRAVLAIGRGHTAWLDRVEALEPAAGLE